MRRDDVVRVDAARRRAGVPAAGGGVRDHGQADSLGDRSAARSLDFEKTAMQDKGFCSAIRLTVAEAVEIVTDLGLDPVEVVYANGCLTTKEALSRV